MSRCSQLSALQSEIMRAGDPYYNYCHWPYSPPASGLGKLRPGALLFQAVSEMPHSDWLTETLQAIRRGIGDFRSVYGIKRIAEQWALEIYIYDYQRQERIVSIERLEASTGGRLRFPETVDPQVPYFMFSFDLTEQTAAAGGSLESVHVYIGNPGSDVSSGIAYEFTDSTCQLENFYFFFDAQKHQDQIIDKLGCSVYSQPWLISIHELYRPELRNCHTICLANKRTCDTVYFSGVTIDQLEFFLQWQQYPAPFREYVRASHSRLDHLLFDVGVDYRVVNGRIEFLKHGIYGVF
ncbi:MAG: hypothetical protein KDA85_19575 [Planctomycetaceae bacterium]|nr:hypothetical protein [Planctomycetaceae bacterium]